QVTPSVRPEEAGILSEHDTTRGARYDEIHDPLHLRGLRDLDTRLHDLDGLDHAQPVRLAGAHVRRMLRRQTRTVERRLRLCADAQQLHDGNQGTRFGHVTPHCVGGYRSTDVAAVALAARLRVQEL